MAPRRYSKNGLADKLRNGLRCSFCQKSDESVRKLFGAPGEGTGAYICDECVSACALILEDDPLGSGTGASETNVKPSDVYVNDVLISVHPGAQAILRHPLTPQLLAAVGRWIAKEFQGVDATEEITEVRKLAATVMLSKSPG